MSTDDVFEEMVLLDQSSLECDIQLGKLTIQQIDEVYTETKERLENMREMIVHSIREVGKRCHLFTTNLKKDVISENFKIEKSLIMKADRHEMERKLAAIVAVNNLRWDRFCTKLCHLINNVKSSRTNNSAISHQILSFEKNPDEISRIQDVLSKSNYSLLMAVRISKPSLQGTAQQHQSPNSVHATDTPEFISLLSSLSSWARQSITRTSLSRNGSQSEHATLKPSLRPSSSSNIKNIDPTLLLTTESIAWIHIASYNAKLWDNVIHEINDKSITNQEGPFPDFLRRFTSQHLATVANSFVYFCMEERSKASTNRSEYLPSRADKLQEVYLSPKAMSPTDDELFQFKEFSGRHRQTDLFLANLPDVIKCKKGYHFATASIAELVETRAFSELSLTSDQIRIMGQSSFLQKVFMNKVIGASNSFLLQQLYVLVRVAYPYDSRTNSMCGDLVMMPLSSSCLTHLLKTSLHLDINSDVEEADTFVPIECLPLLPDRSRDRDNRRLLHSYCLLPAHDHNHSEYRYSCYLIQCYSSHTLHGPSEEKNTIVDENTLLDLIISSRLRNDFTTLQLAFKSFEQSSIDYCSCRGCRCLSVKNLSEAKLCAYHSQFQLDVTTVQKKVSIDLSSSRKDQEVVNSDGNSRNVSSALLEALHKGMIRKQMKSFLKKRCEDLRFRNLLHHFRDIPNRLPPDWAKIKDADDLERIHVLHAASLKLFTGIFQTECEVTEEINALSRLAIYPSAEVGNIRKQFRYFREQQELGKTSEDPQYPMYLKDLEVRVTENKLSILRIRRLQIEESQLAHQKKLARLKFLEESQSKDPHNFKNQKKY